MLQQMTQTFSEVTAIPLSAVPHPKCSRWYHSYSLCCQRCQVMQCAHNAPLAQLSFEGLSWQVPFEGQVLNLASAELGFSIIESQDIAFI